MPDMERGAGTVFWRADRQRWVGLYDVHDGSQKRKRRAVSDPDRKTCERKLREARRISATLPAFDGRMRLDRFLSMWLEDHVLGSVRPRTADNYRSTVEHHIAKDLGGHKLAGLRPGHVLQWRNAMLARGDHPRSVSHRLTTLRAALAWGVQMEMIERNPASLVPGPNVPQSTAKPLTVEQAQAFLAHVRDDHWHAIYRLAFMFGLRQGEILGLRWQYVGDRKLEIAKELTWLRGMPTLEDPKTPRSHRTIELPSVVVAALKERERAQKRDRLRSGRWSPHFDEGYDFVFSDPDGYPIERTQVTRAFQRHLKAAGLPKVSFRSIRHTATDSMRELGLTLQEQADILGHAKPSQTSDTYSYLGNAATEKAAKLYEEMA